MARPPHARDKVLSAYVNLLVEGERSATLDAVAARAGVSKGGLLYHFASKDALAEAVLALFAEITEADLDAMRDDPEGPTRNFIRTSWQIDDTLEPVYRGVLRLAQGGNAEALAALDRLHAGWLELIEDEVKDASLARTIMLIGDGLYHHSSMPGDWSRRTFDDLDDLLTQVNRLLAR